MTIESGSIMNWLFNSTANSYVSVTGTLTINGGGINLYNESSGTQYATNGTYSLFQYGTLSGSVNALSILNSDSSHSYRFATVTSGDSNYVTLTIADPANDSWLTGASPVTIRVKVGSSTKPASITISNSGAESANYSLASSGTNGVSLSSTTGTVAGNDSDSSVSAGWANTSTVGSRSGSITITNGSNLTDTPAAIEVTGAVVDDRVLNATEATSASVLHVG